MTGSMGFEPTDHLHVTVSGTDSVICGVLKEGAYYSLKIILVTVNY